MNWNPEFLPFSPNIYPEPDLYEKEAVPPSPVYPSIETFFDNFPENILDELDPLSKRQIYVISEEEIASEKTGASETMKTSDLALKANINQSASPRTYKPRLWSQAEKDLLLRAYDEKGPKWTEIANTYFSESGRSARECEKQLLKSKFILTFSLKKVKKPSIPDSKYTSHLDELLSWEESETPLPVEPESERKNGSRKRNWIIETGRTPRSQWSPEENDVLLKAHDEQGPRWKEIAKTYFSESCRSAGECETQFYNLRFAVNFRIEKMDDSPVQEIEDIDHSAPECNPSLWLESSEDLVSRNPEIARIRVKRWSQAQKDLLVRA